MKNKIKVIISIVTIIIIALITTFIYIYDIKGDNNKKITVSNNTESDVTASNTNSTQNEVDWSKYETYNLKINNQSETISKEGVYNITGTISNGSIKVNTEGNVKLVLNNVTITNNNGPAIIVENAKNTYIELKGTNKLTAKATETEDAAIFSHDDLFMEGEGTLEISSNYDGIASKDDLTFLSGTYKITTDDDGIRGKDTVTIKEGTFTINAKGNGIKTTNETEKGEIVIENGTLNINSNLDGIQSINTLTINDGNFTIKTTGSTNNSSAKGLKAEKNITINCGKYSITTTDDSIHSNENVLINKGTFTIKSNDDGIHADGMVTIKDGTISITGSEGIEATYVKIEDGKINIEASDDGINATSISNSYTATLEITGGTTTINMGQGDTDAIDSNGNLYITGGTIDITAQSPFDYDGDSKFTGGTVTVNGEKVTALTNQMMGGPQGQNQQGMRPGGGRH